MSGRLAPSPRTKGDWREVHEFPAQRRCRLAAPAARYMECPEPLRSGELPVHGVPIDLRVALKLQQVAGLEINEQQRGARLRHQIAKCIEVMVAAKIRNDQYIRIRIAVDADEARQAAAMRDVRAECGAMSGSGAAGDKKCISFFDGRSRRCVEPEEGFGGGRIAAAGIGLSDDSPLNVLRTITEALIDCDFDAAGLVFYDAAVGANAPACRKIDAQNADLPIRCERVRRGIGGLRHARDLQRERVRRVHEARQSGQQGRDGPTGCVDRTDE